MQILLREEQLQRSHATKISLQLKENELTLELFLAVRCVNGDTEWVILEHSVTVLLVRLGITVREEHFEVVLYDLI